MNGLLRDYFPKGTDLGVHTAEDIARIAAEVNERPRKTLGWQRPAALFYTSGLAAHRNGSACPTAFLPEPLSRNAPNLRTRPDVPSDSGPILMPVHHITRLDFLMALNGYLRLKGAAQGDIKGSVTQKGREGRIAVIAVLHEIVSPRDAASGQATGKRMHKPLVVTKELDKSTPLLHRALVTNEQITSLTLDFVSAKAVGGAAGGAGTDVNDYTISLENAAITSIRLVMPNNRDAELAKRATYEEIAFTYQKITWTWVDGGITASDDWEAPVV